MKNLLNKALLTGRTYQVDGTWYAPEKKLQEFPSVVMTELYNTSSSAGNWDGYFVQKLNNRYYLIIFFQQNNGFRASGFTLWTASVPMAEFSEMPTKDLIYKIIENSF